MCFAQVVEVLAATAKGKVQPGCPARRFANERGAGGRQLIRELTGCHPWDESRTWTMGAVWIGEESSSHRPKQLDDTIHFQKVQQIELQFQ